MSIHSRLDLVIGGGGVTRFHAMRTIQKENVAEHSYLVAWICSMFYHNGCVPPILLMAALQHDIAEYVVGDIPAPVKRHTPAIKVACDTIERDTLRTYGHKDYCDCLNEPQHVILKFADNAAGALYCVTEMRMGNKLIRPVYHNYLSYLEASYAQHASNSELAISMSDILWYIKKNGETHGS